MKPFLVGLALSWVACAWAGPTPAPVKAEIDGLMRELGEAKCRFQRNGKWHTLDEARQLMAYKLKALEEKTTLTRAEDFIDQAATQSSTTGQVYQVQCGNQAAQASGPWLHAALKRLRAPR